MATCTLRYFDIRGLGELPRLVLTAAGVDFKDERVPFSLNADGTPNMEHWTPLKDQQPYGQLPVLEVEGQAISQSHAIVRFVAKKNGMAGDSDVEAALIDAGYEAIRDLKDGFFAIKRAGGDEQKLADYWAKTFGQKLGYFSKNIRGEPFFAASNQLSYTDVALYYTLYVLATENKEAVEKAFVEFPKVKAIYDAVEKEEKIAKYLAQRKVTPM